MSAPEITTDFLAKLRKVAELAQREAPGPWTAERREQDELDAPRYDSDGACLVMALEDCTSHPVADCSCNHSCRMFGPQDIAAFIAMSDPPTIIALLDHIETIKTAP